MIQSEVYKRRLQNTWLSPIIIALSRYWEPGWTLRYPARPLWFRWFPGKKPGRHWQLRRWMRGNKLPQERQVIVKQRRPDELDIIKLISSPGALERVPPKVEIILNYTGNWVSKRWQQLSDVLKKLLANWVTQRRLWNSWSQ